MTHTHTHTHTHTTDTTLEQLYKDKHLDFEPVNTIYDAKRKQKR